MIVVPGGFGTRPLLQDSALLDWVKDVHERTTCLEATTHWAELETLRDFGDTGSTANAGPPSSQSSSVRPW